MNINIKCNSEHLTISQITNFINFSMITGENTISYFGTKYILKSNCTETYINYIISELK